VTAFEDLFERVSHIIGGNREAHPLEAGALPVIAVNGNVDADDFAPQVDQRAAGISRVDGGVGLEQIPLGVGQRPLLGGNNPLGHRFPQAERIADREHHLPDPHLRGIAELERHKRLLALDLEHGDVEQGVLADQDCRIGFAIVEGYLDLLLAGNHMVVGDGVAFIGDDDAGPFPGRRVAVDAGAAPAVAHLLRTHAGRVNADHGGHHRGGQPGVFLVQAAQQFGVFDVERRQFGQREGLRTEISRAPAATGQ